MKRFVAVVILGSVALTCVGLVVIGVWNIIALGAYDVLLGLFGLPALAVLTVWAARTVNEWKTSYEVEGPAEWLNSGLTISDATLYVSGSPFLSCVTGEPLEDNGQTEPSTAEQRNRNVAAIEERIIAVGRAYCEIYKDKPEIVSMIRDVLENPMLAKEDSREGKEAE